MIYDTNLSDNYVTEDIQAHTTIENRAEKNFSFASDKSSNASRSSIDIGTFVDKLKSMSKNYSTAKCAKSIRIALQSAGAKIVHHPVAASDWGETLKKIGYRQINPAFDNPKKGDIYIIKRTKDHTYGHIAGYSGSQWISDFKQSSYAVYKENVEYSYYRP